MILLTEAQANAIRGETSPGHRLDPVQVVEGWVLPETVLDDPAHALLASTLRAFPRVEKVSPLSVEVE